MARKPQRDLTMAEQLARGPLDLPFLMLVVMLMGMGLIMVFSASYASAMSSEVAHYDPLHYIKRQAFYALVGLGVMYVVSRINYQTFRFLSVPLLGVSVVLLFLIYIPGLGVIINGARRWLRMLLVAGPTYQPSEIAKIALILFFAANLSKRDSRKKLHFTKRTAWGRFCNWLEKIGFLELLFPYGLVLILVVGLVAFQTHLSGAILIMVGAAAVLFAAGIHLGWFAFAGTLVVGAITVLITLTPYMTGRITLWLDPWSDPRGLGYQTIQSLYAIASGGLLGLGLGNSVQKFDFVPEPENDFIFSILVEELGLVGAAIVLILFALLILRGYWLALHARDKFGALTIVGIITLLAVQVFLNIGVVTNLIPNTGISLPFFSFGGTALMIHLAEMGMVLSISRQIPAPKKD